VGPASNVKRSTGVRVHTLFAGLILAMLLAALDSTIVAIQDR